MRAQWLKDLSVQESYLLSGEAHHHLVNVIRIAVGEKLLLLNGKGLAISTLVESVTKKHVALKFENYRQSEGRHQMDLALGLPKREALELCLKQAVEIGFGRIFMVRSAFSQIRQLEDERLQKILTAALEQSNAEFMPELIACEWADVPWQNYQQVVLLNSQSGSDAKKAAFENGAKLLVVGPEGGFSAQEINFFNSIENLLSLSLPTPILRTPTAVGVGAGLLLQPLLD